jgi:hypothetical protein
MTKPTRMRPNRNRLHQIHKAQSNHEKTKGNKETAQNSPRPQKDHKEPKEEDYV